MGAGAAVAGGVAAAGLAGSAISAGASKSAASQQAGAAREAAALQAQQQAQTRADLSPFVSQGQANLIPYANFYKVSADQLGQAYSDARNNIPGPMTMDNLVKTPGYQFALQQGQRAVQNSNAAKGLGTSGSALQGVGNYVTGLANQTYKDQFGIQQQIYQDYLSQLNAKQNQLGTVFSQMGAPVSLGENAAAQTGNIGAQLAGNQGNALIQAGQAQAAGTTGAANALTGGINSIASAPFAALAFQNALSGGPNSGGVVDTGHWDV